MQPAAAATATANHIIVVRCFIVFCSLIGSGRGGQLAAYRNLGPRGFELVGGAPWSQPVTRDQTGIVGWSKTHTQVRCLVGSANYEDGLAHGSPAREYDPAGKPNPQAIKAKILKFRCHHEVLA